MAIEIRPAQVAEALQIATLHTQVWCDTYQDVAPAEAMLKLDAAHRLAAWQTYLTKPAPHQRVLVAVKGALIVGFIAFGPPSQPAFGTRGEIKHLYVDPKCKRQKIGQQLMQSAFAQMAQDGFTSAALAVVQSNDHARAFYAKMRGVEVGQFIDAGPLWKSENLIIGWDFPA